MALKTYSPRTPGIRWRKTADFSEITKTKPEKALLVALRKSGGRNCYGRMTARRRGGGHKRKLRIIDFLREKRESSAKVFAIEYDPNRSARIALLGYPDGEKRYIICPVGLAVGDDIISTDGEAEIKAGNNLRLRDIPTGIPVHNLEMTLGRGGQVARSAGNLCLIMAKEGEHAHVKMPSGEIRLVPLVCHATIGQVGNIEHDTISLGKAGKSRHLGIRPASRAVAKNPVDHPMGGGEGKSSGGRHPCTPWGKPTKGFKTRKRKPSDKFILKRRE